MMFIFSECGASIVWFGRSRGEPAPNERLSAAFLNDDRILIQDSTMPGYDAAAASRLGLQVLDARNHPDGVPEANRRMKPPFQDRQERQSINPRSMRNQSGCDGQAEDSMGYGSSERPRLRQLMITVEWVEVSRESGEEDHVCLRHGPGGALPFVAEDQVIENQYFESVSRHGGLAYECRIDRSWWKSGGGLTGAVDEDPSDSCWLPVIRQDLRLINTLF